MTSILISVCRWLFSKAVLFLLVLTLLVSAAWFADQIGSYEESSGLRISLQERRNVVAERLDAAKKEVEQDYKPLLGKLEQLNRLAINSERRVRTAEKRLEEVKSRCGMLSPICVPFDYPEIQIAEINLAEAKASHRAISSQYIIQQSLTAKKNDVVRRVVDLEAHLEDLDLQMKRIDEKLRLTVLGRFLNLANQQLWNTAVIVLAVVLSPFLLRTIFYFVIGSVVGLLKPIRLQEESHVGESPDEDLWFGESKVSLDLQVTHGHELLVRQGALQSLSSFSEKSTKFLLNSKVPMTSLASGMYFLTSVTPQGEAAENVTISMESDLYSRVCPIKIPAGASLVLKPLALVGVVKLKDEQIHIRSCWRFLSFHSWLTFQFRHLVFEGPCEVIVRGCRGVKIEAPSKSERLISQHSTIGFTPNIDYSNQRVETFLPYLFGREPLFKDKFSGDNAYFLYEESLTASHKSRFGSSWEGFVDGILRAFGI